MMKKILKTLYFAIRNIFRFVGYDIHVAKYNISPNAQIAEDQVNLNIAAGAYVIPIFKSLDLYTPHYYKSKEQFNATRIEYDLRKDNIPFDDDSVDNIYISHAIEHIEDQAVEKFIRESFRVLKGGGASHCLS